MPSRVEYWDRAASLAWGRYISAAEQATIGAAMAAARVPGTALDVGCGGGRWTRMIIDQGWSATAYDVDADAVKQCAKRNPQAECLLLAPDDEFLPTGDESVTLVLCIEVVQVAHATWFPAESARVLRPGGRLVAVVWNRCSVRGLAADLHSRIRYGKPHGHYRTCYRTWRRRMRAAGLEIEAERGLCWMPFGRFSNSRLVPAGVKLERALGLSRLPSLSPWILVTAVRPSAG